jgi:hypothetical protein
MYQSFFRPAFVLGASLLVTAAFGQVVVPGGTVGNSGNSNVGIAIPNPQTPLHVGGVNGVRIDTYGGIALQNQDGVGNLLWYIKRGNSTDGNDMAMRAYSGFSFAPANSDIPLVRIATSGNVGIGTTSPGVKLQVIGDISLGYWNNAVNRFVGTTQSDNNFSGAGSSVEFTSDADGGGRSNAINFRTHHYGVSAATRMAIDKDGNVGIGTVSPQRRLEVSGADWQTGIRITGTDSNRSWLLATGVAAGDGKFALYDYVASAHRLVVDTSGNVGIGTTNPTNKLEVNGTIRTKEVIVETTGWSDYVFAPDYRLAPLSEVEAHIAAKGTLPGIPSAAEVAEHGVSVGDMQAKLLAKMEEMTLHMIALSKKVEALEAENAALKAGR